MNENHHPLDILKHFIFDKTEHNVRILWVDGKPLFNANDIAKVMGIKKIRNTLLNFDTDEKMTLPMGTLGGIQEMLFLTDLGMYRLLFTSRKPIAKPFRKWTARVLQEIQNTGKYEKNLVKDLEYEKMIEERSRVNALHESLIIANHKRSCVYVSLIKKINGKNLIKLGGTQDIKKSFCVRHPKDYPGIKLLYVIQSEQYLQFEKYILKHKDVKKFKYRKPVKKDGGTSIETFLVTDDELKKVFRILVANSRKYPKSVASNERLEDMEKKFEVRFDKIEKLLADSIKPGNCVTVSNENEDADLDSETILKQISTPKKKVQKRTYMKGNGKCIDCGVNVSKRAKRCVNCVTQEKKFEVSKDDLYDLVWNQRLPFTKIGKMFGVSDNAIRKRCKSLGVEIRKTHRKN